MTSFSILGTIDKNIQEKFKLSFLNTSENIMQNIMLYFHSIFKYLTFQRLQKALIWVKGLR